MQHFTRNTVETSEWCRKCGKATMHRVDGVKLGACLVCLERLSRPRPADDTVPDPTWQLGLFGGKQ